MEIGLELLTKFNEDDLISSYDIGELNISVKINAKNKYFSKISFYIVLREPYFDDEIEIAEDCLVSPYSENQQKFIDNQMDFPIFVNGEKQIDFNVELASTNHGSSNLLDSFKCFPDYVIDKEEFLELYIKSILIDDQGEEFDNVIIVNVKNPWIE